MARLDITPSQTIGPFPHEGWRWAVDAGGSGPVVIEGTLYDGDGQPVDDGWIEAWTPSAPKVEAVCATPGFRRVATDAQGRYRLALQPAAPGEPAAWITLFGRGLLMHQFSAVFLDASSPLLLQVPAERRRTLVAQRGGDGTWRWDIRLQGAQETVFFEFG